MSERITIPERPFEGKKVYFSGSIKGATEADPHFAWHLVQYMGQKGANVLSEHVAARTREEMDEIRAARTGQIIEEMLAQPEPWFDIRRQDNEWVDQATHVVALVNAPSLGVGMEIERAILKPERGLPLTPILALMHEDLLGRLSYMVRGITPEEADFHLKLYSTLPEAQKHIDNFLLSR